jgi:hypothetical protein
MSPKDADNPANRDEVLNFLNKRYENAARLKSKATPKFQVGDVVRLKIYGSAFRKGHEETFTSEMFKIKEIVSNLPVTQYIVSTYNGDEVVRGRFYSSELQLCTGSVFKVEKILKKRKLPNGKVQYFVKWLHFGPDHNSWIDQSDIEDTYND